MGSGRQGNDGLEVGMKSITTLGPVVHGVVGRKTAIIWESYRENTGLKGQPDFLRNEKVEGTLKDLGDFADDTQWVLENTVAKFKAPRCRNWGRERAAWSHDGDNTLSTHGISLMFSQGRSQRTFSVKSQTGFVERKFSVTMISQLWQCRLRCA